VAVAVAIMVAAMVAAMVASMVAVLAALVVASMVAAVAHVLATSSIMSFRGVLVVGALHQHLRQSSSLVPIGGGCWWDHCISDFVADVLATSSLVSIGGGFGGWSIVSATSSLMYQRLRRSCHLVGSVAAVSDILQEAKSWFIDRFSRIEAVTAHTEEMLTRAANLIRLELTSIRAAREELGI
jgi:hypothetical protein